MINGLETMQWVAWKARWHCEGIPAECYTDDWQKSPHCVEVLLHYTSSLVGSFPAGRELILPFGKSRKVLFGIIKHTGKTHRDHIPFLTFFYKGLPWGLFSYSCLQTESNFTLSAISSRWSVAIIQAAATSKVFILYASYISHWLRVDRGNLRQGGELFWLTGSWSYVLLCLGRHGRG